MKQFIHFTELLAVGDGCGRNGKMALFIVYACPCSSFTTRTRTTNLMLPDDWIVKRDFNLKTLLVTPICKLLGAWLTQALLGWTRVTNGCRKTASKASTSTLSIALFIRPREISTSKCTLTRSIFSVSIRHFLSE